jgi:hypothetical protein
MLILLIVILSLIYFLLCKTTFSELVKAFNMNTIKKITTNLTFGVVRKVLNPFCFHFDP